MRYYLIREIEWHTYPVERPHTFNRKHQPAYTLGDAVGVIATPDDIYSSAPNGLRYEKITKVSSKPI